MKKGIKKAISTIAILTMTFQMGMPVIPGLQTTVLATDTINSVEENIEENIQPTADKVGTTELSESADATPTEEISRNYEIKNEETWDISANGDGSVIAKWTLEDKTLTISGTGEIKSWNSASKEDWHNTQYADIIEKVIINEGITNIGEYAFYECDSLTNINIPEGVINIGESVFYGCTSLTSIEIAESVTGIESYALSRCSSLTNVDIPAGVINIANSAFYGCSNLESINIDENNKYYISENGILFDKEKTEIICYPEGKKDIKEYIIPEGVTRIGSNAFEGCSRLESIKIPEGVIRIGDSAFERCSSLKSIVIPESITSIGDSAFEGCRSLESINIPEGVTSLEYDTFFGCSSLKSINIPEKVRTIERKTFSECSSLESIEIPEGVTSIEREAFSGCKSLKSINIPEGVTSIGSEAFSGCNSLESINIPEGVTSIGSEAFSGCNSLESINIPEGVTSIGIEAFSGCNSLESINIPEGVTSIGDRAFNGCASLVIYVKADTEGHRYVEENKKGYILEGEATNIGTTYRVQEETWDISANGDGSVIAKWTLSDKTLTISGTGKIKDWRYENPTEDWHDSQYTNLIQRVIIEKGITYIGNYAFDECGSLMSIEIPEGVTSIGESAFDGCSALTNITIPQGVTSIGECAFYGCSSLTNIEIPKGVTSIEYGTFSRCSSLTSIEISEGITNIGDRAFNGCSSLTSIEIPESVTNIGSFSFFECGSLESINVDVNNMNYVSENGIIFNKEKTEIIKYPAGKKDLKEYNIPSTVTRLEECAFEGCSSLENIKLSEKVKSIGVYTFLRCDNLKSINIPEEVTNIGDYAFEGCSSLTSINISEGVTSIGNKAFSGCSSLKNINIPKRVTSIGSSAFSGCNSLESVSIPESVTSIEDATFSGCSSLTSINISEGVTSIGRSAFSGCSSLESVSIPESVTSIEDATFSGCNSLTSINISEGVTSIEDGAFSGCSSLTSIIIPEGVTSIGYRTFSGCSSLESIIIPEEVTSIGWDAFYGCSSLKSIKIPKNITSIGSDAIPESTIIYTKSNAEGHRYAEERAQGYIIDDIAPTVTFTPNAGQNMQKEYTVTVGVQDNIEEVGVNENRLKYQWTQSEAQPTKESFTESFENGQAITKNTGDGAWYLWVYAEDNVGNETTRRSEAFYFDNTPPTVKVEYSTKNPTNKNVNVTITSNEEIQAVQGWTLSSDKKTLTKEYRTSTEETVTIKDIAGNETKAEVKVEIIDLDSEKYEIDNENRYILRVLPETTVNEFKANIDVKGTYRIVNSNGEEINEEEYVTTGSKLIIEGNTEYRISVIGDLNKNGTITLTDISMQRKHILEIERLENEVYQSGDINGDGKITINDLSKMRKVTLGIEDM